MKKLSAIYHLFVYIVSVCLIIVVQSCSENPVLTEPVPVNVSIESISPEHPLKIGEKFQAVLNVENLNSYYVDNHILFNNIYHFQNRVSGDTIFSYVPYMPVSFSNWILKFYIYKSNVGGSIFYEVQDTLDVLPEYCATGVCIKWSDLDSIGEYDSYYYPEFYGDQYKWIAESNNDTITLVLDVPGSDEGYIETKIKFLDNDANILPEFVELTKIVYDFGAEWSDTLKSGIIKIQDWDTSSIVSGIILAELVSPQISKPVPPTRSIFWFDFSQ